jgi:hypothetical protein
MVVSRSLLCQSGRLLHVLGLDGRNDLRNPCEAYHALAVSLAILGQSMPLKRMRSGC